MAHNNNRVYDVVIRQRRYRTRRLWALLIFHINDIYDFTIYMLHYVELSSSARTLFITLVLRNNIRCNIVVEIQNMVQTCCKLN